MSDLSWLHDAIKSDESGAVTTCNQANQAPLVTVFSSESLAEKGIAGTVTTVTTVTKQKEGIPIFSAERKRLFSANDPTPDLTPRFAWLVHFTDQEPVYATFSPEATHAEVLRGYPDAVAAEPADSAPGIEPAAPTESADTDDRTTCRLCQNFTYSGICTVARPGGLVSAQKGYRPAMPDALQRCNGYEHKPERNSK
jgi:hypothetical protein